MPSSVSTKKSIVSVVHPNDRRLEPAYYTVAKTACTAMQVVSREW